MDEAEKIILNITIAMLVVMCVFGAVVLAIWGYATAGALCH